MELKDRRQFTDLHEATASSENKWGDVIIDGDRFGLPLGFHSSSPAKTRTPWKQAGYDEKGKLENGPDDQKDDIKQCHADGHL